MAAPIAHVVISVRDAANVLATERRGARQIAIHEIGAGTQTDPEPTNRPNNNQRNLKISGPEGVPQIAVGPASLDAELGSTLF